MAVGRSGYRHRSCRDDSWLRERLLELAREKPRFGYRRLHVLLRREAVVVNHKRVQRVYSELGLAVKRNRRKRRKRLQRNLQPCPVLVPPNQDWTVDFASDVTAAGQRFRVLSVIDSFTRAEPGAGDGIQFPQPAGEPRTGEGHEQTRQAAGDSP
jgi:transposase InsO family protein